MKDKPVWLFVHDFLQKEIPVVLLVVVDSTGASPGRAGFKMAIASTGDRTGTIGGGVMEVNWAEQALNALREGSASRGVKRIYHSREATLEQSGLICSGSQTIVTVPLGDREKESVKEILRSFEAKESGRLSVAPGGFSYEPGKLFPEDRSFSPGTQDSWIYRENLGVLDTIYIVGSGHVGLALSRIMATLDFRVVVFDDRAHVETFVRNSYAHEKFAMPYDTIGTLVGEGARSYVAVVTTGYKSDEHALKSVLAKNPRYIGLMGSSAKTKQILDDLRSEGAGDAELSRIHSPIGLPIESHTPEEIAVSIAAEIIKVRNASA